MRIQKEKEEEQIKIQELDKIYQSFDNKLKSEKKLLS